MAAQREWIAKMQAALGPRLSAAESAAVRAREMYSTVHDEELQSHSDVLIDRLVDESITGFTAEDNYAAWWKGEDEVTDDQDQNLNLDVPLDSDDEAADYEVEIDLRNSAEHPETAASANAEQTLEAYEQPVWRDSPDTGPEDDGISPSDDYDPYNGLDLSSDNKRRYPSMRQENAEKTVDPSQIDLFAPVSSALPAIRSAVRFVPRSVPATRTLYVRESKARCNALFAERISQQSKNADDEGTMSLFDKIMRRGASRRQGAGNNSDEASDQNSEESGDELGLGGLRKKRRHVNKSKEA